MGQNFYHPMTAAHDNLSRDGASKKAQKMTFIFVTIPACC